MRKRNQVLSQKILELLRTRPGQFLTLQELSQMLFTQGLKTAPSRILKALDAPMKEFHVAISWKIDSSEKSPIYGATKALSV